MPYTGLWTFPDGTEFVRNLRRDFPDSSSGESLELPNAFIRPVTVVPATFSFASLERLLKRTDRQLDRMAECVGGTVVPHDWGFIEGESYRYFPPRHWFGNGYYGLFAKVNRIIPANTPDGTNDQIKEGIKQFYRRPSVHKKLIDFVDDFGQYRQDQFIYGHDATQQDNSIEPELFLTDIEPLYNVEMGVF